MLTMLYLFGPEALRSPSPKDWWTRTCKQWADTLDTVIWLDAANATLLERVRARKVGHRLKGKSDAEAFEFLRRYRESYGQVIAWLTANNDDLKVLTIDTARESLDRVVNGLLLEFGLKESRA
jgi:thymidylate kinase